MNRQYTYIDGDIIINNKENQKIISYSNDIEEISKQENLVKILKTEINDLEDIKSDIGDHSKLNILKPFIHWFLYPLIWTIVAFACNLEMLVSFKTFLIFDFLFLFPISIIFSIQEKINYSKDKKIIKNLDEIIKYSKIELNKENDKLLELKKVNNNIIPKKNINSSMIDDEKIFDTLKNVYAKLNLNDLKIIKDFCEKLNLIYEYDETNRLLEYLLEYLDNEKDNNLVKKKILKR